jgi:hypothetical protein
MPTLPPSPPPPPFVGEIATGPLMGTFGILLLYGMNVMQAYQYYTTFDSDRIFIKILVGIILALESLHLALGAHYNYYYLIEHYGQPEYILRIVWSDWLSSFTGFWISWLVNLFFVRRIYVLSKRLSISIIIGILATVRPAIGFTASTFPIIYPDWVTFRKHVQWMFITGLSIGLATDFLIAFAISFYLLRGRDTSVPSTRNIVRLLLWYTINTTGILSFFAVVEFIFLLRSPQTLVFLGLFQIQIQLYANCFLASLNARQNLRKRNMTHVAHATPMATLKAATVVTSNPGTNTTDLGTTTAGLGSRGETVIRSMGESDDVNISTEKVVAI